MSVYLSFLLNIISISSSRLIVRYVGHCRYCFTFVGKNIAYKKPGCSLCMEIGRLDKDETQHLQFLKNCLTVT